MRAEIGPLGRLRRRLRGHYIQILVSAHVVWLLIVFGLGAWWAHVMMHQGDEISRLQGLLGIAPAVSALALARIQRMVHWEAGAFFLFLSAATTFLLWLYVRDHRRTRSIHAFFASLTHELRTPLTSIRLQAESIAELEKSAPAAPLVVRLLEDTVRLESEVERTLELARIEGGGPLFPQALSAKTWVERFIKRWQGGRREVVPVTVKILDDLHIQADAGALQVIFRNLLENTLRHAKPKSGPLAVAISAAAEGSNVLLEYSDNGAVAGVDPSRLGQLFQKGPGSPGAGVGLYLIRALMERMNGSCSFAIRDGFRVRLHFRGGHHDAES